MGFRFQYVDNVNAHIVNKSTLIINTHITPNNLISYKLYLRAENPLGKIIYQPKLHLKDYERVLLFPQKNLMVHSFEELPFLRIDYLQQKLNFIENNEPGGIKDVVETQFFDKIKRTIYYQNLLIYGSAGSGKTFLLISLARKLMKEKTFDGIIYVNLDLSLNYEQLSQLHIALIYILKSLYAQITNGYTPVRLREIIKRILKISEGKEITRYLINSIIALAEELSRRGKKKILLLFDAMDRLNDENRKEFIDTVNLLISSTSIFRIVITSRAEEPLLGIQMEKLSGFTIEDSIKYLSEFNMPKILSQLLPKPILPIYLRYLKIIMRTEENNVSAEKLIKEIPKKMNEFHNYLISQKLNSTQRKILDLLSLFGSTAEYGMQLSPIDLVKLKRNAIAYALNLTPKQLEEIVTSGYLRYLIEYNETTFKIFHLFFEEFIFTRLKNKPELKREYLKALIKFLLDKWSESNTTSTSKNNEIKYAYLRLAIYFIAIGKFDYENLRKVFLQEYLTVGQKEYLLSNFKFCLQIFEAAYYYHTATGEHKKAASDLRRVGFIYEHLGELSKALDALYKAYEIHERLNDKIGMASDLSGIGVVLTSLDRFHEAFDKFTQAYETYKKINDKYGMAVTLRNIGFILSEFGQTNSALLNLEQAYKLDREIGSVANMASDLTEIATTLIKMKEYDKAYEKLREAYSLFKKLNNKLGMATSLGNMGTLLKIMGRPQEALEKLKKAYEIHKELGDKLGLVIDLNDLGDVMKQLGDLQSALEYHKLAYELHKELNKKKQIAKDSSKIGCDLIELGNIEEGLVHIESGFKLVENDNPSLAQQILKMGIKCSLKKNLLHAAYLLCWYSIMHATKNINSLGKSMLESSLNLFVDIVKKIAKHEKFNYFGKEKYPTLSEIKHFFIAEAHPELAEFISIIEKYISSKGLWNDKLTAVSEQLRKENKWLSPLIDKLSCE